MGGRADLFFRWLADFPSEPAATFLYPSTYRGAFDPDFFYPHEDRVYGPIPKVLYAETFPQFIQAPKQMVTYCQLKGRTCPVEDADRKAEMDTEPIPPRPSYLS